ncbi:MAG: L,D-transpeptidase family protein [Hyphomicrobium sp.]
MAGAIIATTAASAEPPAGTVSTSIRAAIENTTGETLELGDRATLRAYYSGRDYAPVWVDQRGPTRAARLAIDELSKAEGWGLSAAAFGLSAVKAPMAAGRWTEGETARAELEISTLVLKYARQARGGRIAEPEKQLTTYIDRAPRLPETSAVMAEVTLAADPGAVLRAYHPQHPQFFKLKDLLARLKSETATQQTFAIAEKGPALAPGKSYPEITTLRQRFAVAAETGLENVYDDRLVAVVKRFQSAMSLRADGVIGPKTRKALNDSAIEKLPAVVSNMEQWRWMPVDLGATHIFVNVPTYAIDFVNDGVSTFRDRVVVGKADTQTPIFSHEMTTIVMRPEWYLPDSIKLKKLLSGRALESQGLRVKKNGKVIASTSVNWSTANLSAYAVYQPSGGSNALGSVKFLFPNKHSVYLHDTPEKSLFNASERNFSHGCIRVRNPLDLAQKIFNVDRGAGALDAAKLARSGPQSNEITLEKPIPVHIAHFTVWVDDDGSARFMPDRYGHQKRITLALDDRWQEIDRGKDHLAAVDTTSLKSVSLRARSKRKLASTLTDPVGLTKAYGYYGYKSPGGGVGDLIRRAFGN